jgi:restriction endonuclease S subunit
VEKTKNIAPKSQPNTVFSYVDISSINRDNQSIEDPKVLAGEEAPSRAKREIKLGDTLFATTRPNLKNIAVYERELENPVASTGFCVLRPGNQCLSRFLFHFLTTDLVQSQISGHITGAQYPAITDRNLKKISVPIPPLAEQERIVAKLDALFTRIDQAITRLRQTTELIKRLQNRSISQFFRAGEREAGSRQRLDEVTKIQNGSGFPKKFQGHSDEKFPFLKVSDMNLQGNERMIQSWNNSISADVVQKIRAKITPSGTVIFPKIGAAIATNKKRITTVESAFDNNVMGLIPNEQLDSEYLFWMLQNFDLTKWASSSALPSMKSSTVAAHEISLPPLKTQKEVVSRIGFVDIKVQKLIDATSIQLTRLHSLKSSLLDAAFKGKL